MSREVEYFERARHQADLAEELLENNQMEASERAQVRATLAGVYLQMMELWSTYEARKLSG